MSTVALSPPQVEEDRLTPYLGMVVALASWAMLFAALFLSYVLLRVQQPAWPPAGTPPLPFWLATLNTAVLLGSSGALWWGKRFLDRDAPRRFSRWNLVAIGLGLAFLLLQLRLWQVTHAAGLGLSGIFGSLFYVLTWFHAAHMLAGLLALVWMWTKARRGGVGVQHQAPVLVVSMFWHFLDVMWICMYVAIFVV